MARRNRLETDLHLGEDYRDSNTGIVGRCVSIHFYEHGCERAALEWAKDGEIKVEVFDSPRLVRVSTGEAATTTRTGGPNRGGERRPTPPTSRG